MIKANDTEHEFFLYMDRTIGSKSANELTKEYNSTFGFNVSSNTLSKRLQYFRERNGLPRPGRGRYRCESFESNFNDSQQQYDATTTITDKKVETSGTCNSDGSISAIQIIQMTKDCLGNKSKMLVELGFDPNEWEFVHVSWSSSDHHKGDGTVKKSYYRVTYKVQPIRAMTTSLAFDIARDYFEDRKHQIPTVRIATPRRSIAVDSDKLIEISPIELHLGKLANEIDTGDSYDHHIAEARFNTIIDCVIELQESEQAERALVVIGSDFFNSEADGCTSINKIPQQNDTRFKKMFMIGLDLYTTALLRIRESFDMVDVMFAPGNHANAMEFFLYVALQQYFRDTDINFIENYKDTQAYQFGICAIFFNHGDTNLKRLIASIPAEFYEIWGQTRYRELHMGHLHKEVTVDDESGMITRRIGSPSGTDNWHYHNRFVGATRKHELFVWNKNYGLKAIHYINF